MKTSVAAAVLASILGIACSPNHAASGGSSGGVAPMCTACTTDADCGPSGAAHCITEPGGSSYCGPSCTSTSQCVSGATCFQAGSDNVCYPVSQTCKGYAGASSSGTASGSSGSTGTASCPGYAPPNTAAGCPCETGHTCAANHCFGGYYCELATTKCVAEPASCESGTGTTTGTSSGTAVASTTSGTTGAPGTVGPSGGTVDTLNFAVVGDTRPADEGNSSDNQTENYPTGIITSIYQGVQGQNPPAQFAITTGDYQFASPSSSAGAAQVALYAQARAMYSGVVFPAVGNHECTGSTADACNTDGTITASAGGGTSNNYAAFKSTLLDPINQSLPYYVININSTSNAWTSKFVFVACNFWDSAGVQSAWLSSALAQSTTYTFVIIHEDTNAGTLGPCQPAVYSVLSQYPVTLRIAGHVHEYYWNSSATEVVVGNGGASPLSTGTYGYVMITQLPDNNIQISQIDYMTNSVVSTQQVTP